MSIHPIVALKSGISKVYAAIAAIVIFFGKIFTEPDGNGGKASFSRVVGAYVTWNIVQMAWSLKEINAVMWDMFMILVGYQLLSKTLNALSPAILDLFRTMLLKAGMKMEPQKPADPPPAT